MAIRNTTALEEFDEDESAVVRMSMHRSPDRPYNKLHKTSTISTQKRSSNSSQA